MGVVFDDHDFQTKSKKVLETVADRTRKATQDVAEEVLRLSQREVPHNTGELASSGSVSDTIRSKGLEKLVGYNKVYAARLHEHPEYRFQKGRKGKYLEDPIKNNLSIFRKYMDKVIKG